MSMSSEYLASLMLLLGTVIGAASFAMYYRFKLGSYKRLASELLQKAEMDAELVKRKGELALKQMQIEEQKVTDELLQKEKRKIAAEEERLNQREDKLERRMNLVEKKLSDIEKREAVLVARKSQLEEEKQTISEIQKKLISELEKSSGLSSLEAQELLLRKISDTVKSDAATYTKRVRKECDEEAEKLAGTVIATAINRLAVECVSEVTVTTVSIPNDEMKGRIIGREGRNIRALEHATGINFLIDDTPGAIVLSGFDPIRKQIAKLALTELVVDGRIHPTRIEEVVQKATGSVQKLIKQYGEDAAMRAGAIDLHPELILLLGKLKFRFSYGQNVLDHSLEVSYLMGMMAAELGLDVAVAKRIGLLHDVGKAVSHETEGSHAIIGHDLALKYGETHQIANGIGCHHEEIDPLSPEAWLCGAADKISASRPGARIEAVEEYIKRLERLEDLAFEFPAVERAYAMQAGREVRIVVLPDMIDDDGLVNLARDLTKRIERELNYPGKIKVTVIREKRVVEYAV